MSSCLVEKIPESFKKEQERLLLKATICPLCGRKRHMRFSSGSFLWVKQCQTCGLQWHGEPVTGVRVGEKWMAAPDGVMVVGDL